ncbi:MAG TPA: hypothetical protein VGG45_05440 [Terracidiphilus sp.]
MRTNARLSLAAFAFTAFVYPVCGQGIATPPNPNPTQHHWQPYLATYKVTSQQTLADGTIIVRESTETEAQDSQGRHMHSQTEVTPQMGRDPGTSGSANDPVEGTQSTWDSRAKKARVVKLPSKDQREGCWSNDAGTFRMSWNRAGRGLTGGSSFFVSGSSGTAVVSATTPVTAPAVARPKPAIEDLGTQSIDGVQAHGHRFTTTIPAGEIGNDEPLVTTGEDWISTEFGIIVRNVSDDPRSGKRTRELVDLTPGDPDPTTFQPPEGYQVVVEELHQVACPSTP